MTILGCLGILEFWTISDWTELGLVELSLCDFFNCHEFCMSFHFCCMTCLWVSYAWKPLRSGLQFCEELCMQTVGFGLRLRFATSLHYFCFGLRYWSLIDHILPVKMCGTHLGVVLSVIFVGSAIHLLRCESRTLG